MKQILLVICVPLIIYILYAKGYAPVSVKRALMFMGRRKNNMIGASCTACSGFVAYALTLKAGKTYKFSFESEVEEGQIAVELIHKGRIVYAFGGESANRTITAEKGLYTAKTKYNSASGVYNFTWSEVQ